MGLFGKLLGGQANDSAPFTEREAFAMVLMVTVAGDGHISDEEASLFNATVNRMQLFKQQSGDDYSKMIDKLFGLLRREEPGQLLQRAVVALSSEMRETAFAVAADLVFADGAVEDEEQEVLEQIQSQLGIPEADALKILEVIVIKNRG